MQEFIIKSMEEECEDCYWKVTVPDYVSKENVMEKFKMAAKYSTITDCDTEEDYDENFEEMLNFREQSNGECTFNYYIENVCGWKIEPLNFDFVYEW